MFFETSLPHQFPVVNKQIGAGLYGVKTMAAILAGVCAPDSRRIASAQALINERNAKMEIFKKKNGTSDEQMSYMMASAAITDSAHRVIAEAHPTFMKNAQTEIGGALEVFYRNTENIRAGLEAEVKRLETNLEHSEAKTSKLGAQCKKIHVTLLAKKVSIDQLSSDDTNKKAVEEKRKFHALTKKTSEMFEQYEMEVKATDALQTNLYEVKMPEIMKDMEAVERTRLQMIEDKFTDYQNFL